MSLTGSEVCFLVLLERIGIDTRIGTRVSPLVVSVCYFYENVAFVLEVMGIIPHEEVVVKYINKFPILVMIKYNVFLY